MTKKEDFFVILKFKVTMYKCDDPWPLCVDQHYTSTLPTPIRVLKTDDPPPPPPPPPPRVNIVVLRFPALDALLNSVMRAYFYAFFLI